MKAFESDKIEITEEFDAALKLMEDSRYHVFVTGKAGTGKSTLLQYFCDHTKKKIAVLAPTGVSAINIGGATIHSFFRFPFGVVQEDNVHFLRDKVEVFKNLDAIIIDEISMVRADLMNAIDYSLRMHTGNHGLPFGGVQIIMFGDLYQLPPVVMGEQIDYLRDFYGGKYFFYAPVFEQIELKKVQLTKIFRQKDDDFRNLLNKVRERKVLNDDLRTLNARCVQYDHRKGPAIVLAATNNIVNNINNSRLHEIKSDEHKFLASVKGEFSASEYPVEMELRLRKGAQIMMLKNDTESPKRWVNGTLGTVKELGDNHIVIEIGDRSYRMEKAVWEVFDYEYSKEERMIEKFSKGSFTQYPVKLAWAVTIHKSQGKTFDRVIIDFGRGAFAHGQTYVALSRCTKLDEIYLRTPIRYGDIILDNDVVKFHLN